MGNLLRDMLDPDSEYNKQLTEQLNKIKMQMIEDKCCTECANAELVPHIEMGYDAGTDPYCKIWNELKLGYGEGQQCLFWKQREEFENAE